MTTQRSQELQTAHPQITQITQILLRDIDPAQNLRIHGKPALPVPPNPDWMARQTRIEALNQSVKSA
jgi:hypothetical protein